MTNVKVRVIEFTGTGYDFKSKTVLVGLGDRVKLYLSGTGEVAEGMVIALSADEINLDHGYRYSFSTIYGIEKL